jgi:hypothetical protein
MHCAKSNYTLSTPCESSVSISLSSADPPFGPSNHFQVHPTIQSHFRSLFYGTFSFPTIS